MKFIIHIRMSKTAKTKLKCQITNNLNRMQTTAAPQRHQLLPLQRQLLPNRQDMLMKNIRMY